MRRDRRERHVQRGGQLYNIHLRNVSMKERRGGEARMPGAWGSLHARGATCHDIGLAGEVWEIVWVEDHCSVKSSW